VLHCGLTPESTYSGQMGKVVAFALEAAGAPVVKGGSGAAVAAFRALITARGGEVRTGADVDRITLSGGRVTGVELAGGERIACGSVLASVAPGQLHGRLLRDADLPEAQAAQAFRHGRGNFQLHFALDGPPDWIAPGLERVALLHLAEGIDSVSKASNEAERGMLPAVPTVCVGQPHVMDPSRCPAGKAILWCQIPDAPRVVKGDAAGAIAGDGWSEAVREAFADRIEAILARHIRNWDAIRLARVAQSPADLERMNVNLVGGDPYGGLCTIDQFFLFRPFAQTVNHATPVKGLLHIGASTHPGPGLGGGSGYLAAKALGA
jgi:phytoene dehydrogenase-like protein